LAKRDRTVVATFDSADRAEKAVDKLREDGFRENEISIVARDERRKGDRDSRSYDPLSDVTATGLAVDDSRVTGGATTGAAIGAGAGLLASAGALAIPGIGPILAAGPLAATLSGAATGGLAGGLLDYGIPEDRGRDIEEDVRSGRAVAFVETDSRGADRAQRILKDSGARKVETHNRS